MVNSNIGVFYVGYDFLKEYGIYLMAIIPILIIYPINGMLEKIKLHGMPCR